ncbi:MAG TPA: DUF1186 domain-containing protein [Candidatus Babeliales bacterium]|nr:DUF1186 domain-containing protein [Candidatus Babeliales bacterium]
MNNITTFQYTIPQIITALNQRNKVPEAAINTAILYKEEIIPTLLAIVKNAAENYQKLTSCDVDYITAMYILAKLREPQACQYIIKLASLYRDWPEKLLGDVITEGVASLIVSTYDGNLKAIKNLIEHTHANISCRSAALDSLLGLFAIGKLSREEIINYYRDLLHSPLVEDGEFASQLLKNIYDIYPSELYDDAMVLFDKGNIDTWYICKEDLRHSLDMGLDACLKENIYTYKFYLPIDNVIEEVSWLYHPVEQEYSQKPKIRVGRNSPCPCNSGKKYKRCCMNLNRSWCCEALGTREVVQQLLADEDRQVDA